MDLKPRLLTFLLLTGTALMALFVLVHTGAGKSRGWSSVIRSDGRGYYAYLPSFVLFAQADFDSCVKVERAAVGSTDYLPEYLVTSGGHRINKYFTGVALLQVPFFLAAMAVSTVAGLPVTGYSPVFQFFAGTGTLAYLLLGLWFLGQILLHTGVRPRVALFTLFVITAGTNLLYYTVQEPLMSHVYSFCAVNAFLWFSLKWMSARDRRHLLLSGLFFGIVLLIRPVNGIVLLLIPFLAGEKREATAAMRSLMAPANALCLLLPAAALFGIQLAAWKLQTGSWWIWPYGDEGFNWLRPAVGKVLFGFRKGLFVYTPVTLTALAGLFYFRRSERHRTFSALLFLLVMVYILSAWWNWYYGDGFGMRPAIDVYGFFAILLATALERSRRAVSAVFATVALVLTGLSLIQTWQAVSGILPVSGMDGRKYGYLWLRTNPAYADSTGGSDEIPWYGTDTSKSCFTFTDRYVTIGSLSEFNTGPNLHASILPLIPGRYYVAGNFYARDMSRGAGNAVRFVISIENVDSLRNFWYGFRINGIPSYDTLAWRPVHFAFNTPVISWPGAYIKTFLWNPSKVRMRVAFFTLKFYPAGMAPSAFEEHDSIGGNPLLPSDEP